MECGDAGHQAPYLLPGAVGAVIVHEQDRHPSPHRLEDWKEPALELLDVLPLVVRGDDHGHPGSPAASLRYVAFRGMLLLERQPFTVFTNSSATSWTSASLIPGWTGSERTCLAALADIGSFFSP